MKTIEANSVWIRKTFWEEFLGGKLSEERIDLCLITIFAILKVIHLSVW